MGSIYPNPIAPKVFHANLYKYPYVQGILGLRAFLSIYFLYCYFYYSISKDKYNKRHLNYLYSWSGFFDWFMVLIFFITFGYALKIDCDENKLLNSKEYYDFTYITTYYDNILILNAWSTLFAVFRLLKCLTINKRIYLLKSSLEIAAKKVLVYIFMVSPIIVCFAFMGSSIWGPYFIYYRRLNLSIMNNLFFSIGQGNSSLQLKINLFWTVMFYLFFMIFIIFMFIAAMAGIYMDGYMQNRINEGYRDSVKTWAFLDYFLWLFGCFSKRKLKIKIEDYLKKRKERTQHIVKYENPEENRV